MKLSVLVLHNLGDPLLWRQALVEKELCLPIMSAKNNYIVHDAELPLPDFVKDIHFDAIMLTQTFLSKRSDPRLYKRLRENYSFIKDSPAFKIALPQDDYTCCDILDRWMHEWNVDLVYTVCINDWHILYKEYHKTNRLVQGYTGYISDALIERGKITKPIQDRSIDVSYRAASLSPVFGKLGKIKTEIGDLFEKASRGCGLKLDLSTRPSSTIVGKAWLDFIEDSKCMLGVNSGSSLLDPEGLINIDVYKYMQLHSSASYEEVEAACFPGLDGIYTFTSISPRNMECGLLKTTQLLTPGSYGNFIMPWEHFIPIEPDMSNFSEIISVLKDVGRMDKITADCKEALLSFPELRYANHVSDLIDRIQNGTILSDTERNSATPLFKKYQQLKDNLNKSYWWKKRAAMKLREGLADLGARKAKYIIYSLINIEKN